MKKNLTLLVGAVCLMLQFANNSFAQVTVNVRVLSVEVVNSVDCDGFFTGDSDFVWEFLATDNTLGNTNNNPVLFGLLGDFNYYYQNGNNGPYVVNAPGAGFSPNSGLYFTHDYVCMADVPTQITIDWRAYENDDVFNYSLLGITDGETANQSVTMAVPAAPGVIWQTFTATSTDAGCNQTYRVTFEVETIGLSVTEIPDMICNAINVPLNANQLFALCGGATLEPNEPNTGDVTANGSAWFYFIAPPSGAVEITTDLPGTEIGTYIEIYHAADGVGCIEGIQPITGAVIKNKFDYLSHIEFSDGIDLLGIDPEAEIILAACDPINPFSYQKLIPGETYYVQVALDNAGQSGYCEVAVNDQGGSPPDLEDIPCLSPGVPFGTAAISSALGSGPTVNLGFGCAYDGGNNFGETGAPHTSPNPDEYHAYDYDHVATGNGTMNESVWLNFVAPNNGRIVFETDYQSAIYSEDNALFGFDRRFGPGTPTDYTCADLENLAAAEGGLNGFLGGSSESALILQPCLEPGYTYYGMIDPANNLTGLSTQNIDSWLYDPSVADPVNNPPGNDILCLTMLDPLFEIVVTPAGVTPPFQAVAGSNELGCTEYLAGEPPVDNNPINRADQTVWHFFTVPPSGAIEMNLRAYIGMDTLRYAVYELLNGTDCYGGLNPATFTQDGTQLTPIITPVLQGSAGFSGTQESICCLTPGTMYAVQLDGGSPGDEGQYIIEYIREVESYAGDTYVQLANNTIITPLPADTAFVCFNDSIDVGNALDGIGNPTLDIPSCLEEGFVMHSTSPLPNPVTGSGFTYIDTIRNGVGFFINNTDGSGSFGNPLFNTVYYVSSMADEPATWGDFTCNSSTVDNIVNIVYLQPIVPVSSYDNALCEITFTSSGGLSTFYGTDFAYTIQDALMNLVQTGTFAAGVNVVYAVPSAEVYTITIDDGACPYSFTVDASACGNPCIISPIIEFVNTAICQGQSIFLEGANQTTAGLYTDVFVAANGCDSTIYTTLTVNDAVYFEQTVTICQGTSLTVGTSVYSTPGVYQDTYAAANLCDSIVTTNLFVENTINTNIAQTICEGTSYSFAGTAYVTSGIYVDNLIATQGGCDSVVTLYLTVIPLITSSTSLTICEGDSYIFGSQTLTSSGTFTEMYTTPGGCDSLATMYFFVNPIIENSLAVTLCQGQSYTLGTQTLSATGNYTENFVTPAGCDSVVNLFLTVTNQLQSSLNDTICLGDSYTFGTQTLTQSGQYSELYATTGGCDSLVTINLVVEDCEALLEISNIVTPNDDGNNDTWKVSDVTQISGCTVQIFNRWGQLVFETVDYNNNWGGTKEGELLPDGVYYYVISCDADREYQGAINLMRYKK
ncbi:MAG: gliding motility-associated C-terminal domain-containing protein [Fluviicola sp.]|nr:gliding motility-associated C-terminal domain-containing protein [Fluviicola sp.]